MAALSYEEFTELYSGLPYDQLPSGNAQSKRYGMYIGPMEASTKPTLILDSRIRREKDGTWEYLTPPRSISASNGFLPSESDNATPAQKLAMSYRAVSSRTSNDSDTATLSYPTGHLSPNSWQHTLVDEDEIEATRMRAPTTASSAKGSKARHSAIRRVGLLQSFKEAMESVKKDRQHSHSADRIVCPRPECHDTLPDVNGLTHHLHIHDIGNDNDLFVCPRCKRRYEHSHELNMHNCRRRGASVSEQIGAAFCRVLRIKSNNF